MSDTPTDIVARRAVLGGLAACAAPTAVRAQPAQRTQPIRIGVLGDYGSGRDLGGPGSVIAARLAAEDHGNAVLGRPVEIRGADHHNKPDIASSLASQWFEVEGVHAITDLAVSSVGLAVARLAAARDRTVLISGSATSDLTGIACTPTCTHWADDTYVLSVGLARSIGPKRWFFVAVDYALGEAVIRDGSRAVRAAGGVVVGSIRFPFNTTDFSSVLLAAQTSGADVVAFASTGADTINAVKQFAEFGLNQAGQTVVGVLTFISDVHAIGLELAQGMVIASQYYWDDDAPSRAFARRFASVAGRVPTKLQAATYAAVSHYLAAIAIAGTTDARPVNAAMRALPVDFFGRPGLIRSDGRVLYDLGLYRVKAPAASRAAWDYYERLSTIEASAFRPLADGGCRLA